MIKDQESDLKFSNSLLSNMLKESDIFKIKQRSVWDESKKEWSIPSFLLTEKKSDISFPTINAKQRIEQQRDNRSI